ncbi:MAG: DUF362 domain-containing protein [Myxococcales bacterium]|nr:DUF362 domain-containing protein [Myxococcales bacterium]
MERRRKRRGINRRDFLRLTGAGVAAAGISACLPHTGGDWSSCEPTDGGAPPSPASARVVEVHLPGVVEAGYQIPDRARVARAIERGLLSLTGDADLGSAWSRILGDYQTNQVVGLKVNCLNKKGVPTSIPVIAGLVSSLSASALMPPEDLLVWDRRQDEFEVSATNLTADAVGCPVRATEGSQGSPGYEEEPACLVGRKMYWSKILTRGVQHLLNVAVLKNHTVSGFTGVLKNHYGSFIRPGDFHRDALRAIPELNTLPAITSVSRLCVIDALIGVSTMDTDGPPDCKPERILLSFDPVAVDSRGVDLRDEILLANPEVGRKGPPAPYLEIAEGLGLGSRAYQLVSITVD